MKLRTAILACAAFVSLTLASPPLRAQDAPLDAQAVIAKVRAAQGTSPENFVEVIDVSDGSTLTTYRIGDDRRIVRKLAPFESSSGIVGGQRWHQTENGSTVFEQPEPKSEAPIPTTTTLARVSDPFDAYVVSVLDRRGFGVKTFVDPQTWHVLRIDDVRPGGTQIAAYSDYRTVAGFTLPFAWTTEYRGEKTTYTIATLEPGKATAADVALPAARRRLVDLPPGTGALDIPVTVDADQFVVRLQIGGRGLDFLLDSGAGGIEIDEGIAKELGLPLYDGKLNDVNGGAYEAHRTIVPEVSVGPIVMHDVVMGTVPELQKQRPGAYKVVGLLGFDFIDSLVLKLDYENRTLTAFDPNVFNGAALDGGVSVPVRIGSDVPMTDVAVNGFTSGRFTIDTGAGGTILTGTTFSARYPNALSARDQLSSLPINAIGVGGTFTMAPTRFATVDVGGGAVTFKDFAGFRLFDPRVYPFADGLIGAEFLKYFTVYFDYRASRIFLQRNGIRS